VLHTRRFPTTAQPLEHLVVTAGATFVVLHKAAIHRGPVSWTNDGYLSQAGVGTEPLEHALAIGAHAVGATTAELLGPGWITCVVPVIAVAGP
jgi:hypothetical protein